jgi:acyl-CoA synthetase (AMP-forming)/AMP-acid ligase II
VLRRRQRLNELAYPDVDVEEKLVPIEDVLAETYNHPRLPLELQDQFRREGLWAGVTLAQCVEERAQKDPDRVAVVGDRVLTYGEVWNEARRLGGALQERGAQPGEYLLAVLHNSWQGIVLEVAASIIGAVFTPRSPHISPALALNLFDQLDVRGIVLTAEVLDKPGWREALATMESALNGRPMVLQGELRGLGLNRAYARLEDLASTGPLTGRVKIHPTAPSLVLSTGGTTGVPKSILHCSDALVYAARHFAAAVNYTEDDVTVAFAPYGHAGGSIFDIYLPLLTGSSVLPIKRWRVQQVGPLIEKWQGTFFVTMGTHVYDLMQQPDCFNDHLRSIRLITTGAGPDSLFQAAQSRFDFTLVRVYGCGECPGHAIGRPDAAEPVRLLKDGVPFRGVEVRIRSGETGEEISTGEVGEYECRGPNLFMGYVGQPALTDEAITPDGFYRSGDLMVRSDDGYITWSGRSKEIIRRGGLQIDPVEMEGILARYPGIGSVVVVGEPEPRLGERAVVVAVVETGAPPPTLDELRAFLTAAGLPPQSLPERLILTDEIPRTELGKFHRARIKETMLGSQNSEQERQNA